MKFLAFLILCFFLTGCAVLETEPVETAAEEIPEGESRIIHVISEPPGAMIEYDNKYAGKAPVDISFNLLDLDLCLSKYYFHIPKKDVYARPRQPGQCHQTITLDPCFNVPDTIYFQMDSCPNAKK